MATNNDIQTESFIILLIRDFYMASGAMDGDFNVNDFNTEFCDSVVEEQCTISISLNGN